MEEFELEPGEEVVLAVRQHILVFILRLLPLAFLAIFPLFISGLFSLFATMGGASLGAVSLPSHLFRFFYGFWLLALWMSAFGMLTRYYLTVWIITNVRIVDIQQHGYFRREVSSFLLIRVQDVTTEVRGFLGTLVGFGRLSVETAGKVDDFCMDNIVRPEHIRDVIMNQVAALHPAPTTYSESYAQSAQDGL